MLITTKTLIKKELFSSALHLQKLDIDKKYYASIILLINIEFSHHYVKECKNIYFIERKFILIKFPIVVPPLKVSPQYADLLSVICTQKNGYHFYLERFVQIYNSRETYDFGELAFSDHIFSINKLEGMVWYNYLPIISDYNVINNINLVCEKQNLIQQFRIL